MLIGTRIKGVKVYWAEGLLAARRDPVVAAKLAWCWDGPSLALHPTPTPSATAPGGSLLAPGLVAKRSVAVAGRARPDLAAADGLTRPLAGLDPPPGMAFNDFSGFH